MLLTIAVILLVLWALGLVSAALLIRYRVNATWLILAGAALGFLLRGLA